MSAPATPRRSSASRLFGWALAIVLTVSLVVLLQSLNLRRVLDLIISSNLALLTAAVLINLTLNTYARARRRQVLLQAAAPSGELGLWELSKLLLASYAANNLLPARAGDVLFAVHLRRQGYSVGSVIAAQVAEKFVEITSLWMLIMPTLALTEIGPTMDKTLYLFLAAWGAFGILFVAFARRGGSSLPRSLRVESAPRGTLLRLVHHGERALWVTLASIRRIATGPVALRALLWSCAQDASDILMVGLVALAVGVHVGPGGWFLVYLAVNLASALPSTPGQLGLIEAGAVFALVGLGVGPNHSMAFALLYHLAHLLPITLLGLPILWRFRSGRRPPEVARLSPSL
jgi:uncharacterized membrane protein YbhN (UPF0104 family)